MIGLTELDFMLKRGQVVVTNPMLDPPHFERNRHFVVDGVEYVIEWWSNIGYLKTNGLTVRFDNLIMHNHWPHKSPMDFVFMFRGEEVCLLKLVDYKK